MDAEQRRIDAEMADKKRAADERAADLQRVKDAAAAEVRAAEAKANREQGGLKSGATPVPFAQIYGGETVTGTLVASRLSERPASPDDPKREEHGESADPRHGRLESGGFHLRRAEAARQVMVVHDSKPDAQLGTIGNVTTYELR